MKTDERQLLTRMKEAAVRAQRICPRYLATELDINEKRAAYIFEKWERKGWYEYGVNVLAGWLTEEGINACNTPIVKDEG